MTPFVEFLPEGDISVVGLSTMDLIIYTNGNHCLKTYPEGSTEVRTIRIFRGLVWEHLCKCYPELTSARKRYHFDDCAKATWKEDGPHA